MSRHCNAPPDPGEPGLSLQGAIGVQLWLGAPPEFSSTPDEAPFAWRPSAASTLCVQPLRKKKRVWGNICDPVAVWRWPGVEFFQQCEPGVTQATRRGCLLCRHPLQHSNNNNGLHALIHRDANYTFALDLLKGSGNYVHFNLLNFWPQQSQTPSKIMHSYREKLNAWLCASRPEEPK